MIHDLQRTRVCCLFAQLGTDGGHVVVVLSLEEVAGHRNAEVVLGHIVADLHIEATLQSAGK